jgi:hypothetical protein
LSDSDLKVNHQITGMVIDKNSGDFCQGSVVAIRNPLQTRLTKSRNYSIYLEFRREFFIYFAIEHSKT